MEKINLQKIIDSLKIIQYECESNTRCKNCMFYSGECLIIAERPENWKINSELPDKFTPLI